MRLCVKTFMCKGAVCQCKRVCVCKSVCVWMFVHMCACVQKRLYVKTFDWTCNILRPRSSHSNIFASQIFAFCIFASTSHLRTFTPEILTFQIFISYIFISADRRILDLHIFWLLSSHLRHMCATSHLRSSHLRSSYLISSHLRHICTSSYLRS